MIFVRCLLLAIGWLFTLLLPASGQTAAKDTSDKISYYKDVRPIFQQHCQGCHQPARAKGGFIMTGHADLFKKSEHYPTGIGAGQPDKSAIVAQINSQDGKPPAMPRGKEPLTPREVLLITRWVAQGAG